MRTNSDMVGKRTPASAYGIATLDANTKVVQNPADATATPTASKIPIADGSGTLNGWISGAPSGLTAIQPIWDKTVTGSAVASVTTNGEVTLDGNAHGGYEFDFVIVNPSGTVAYRLFYNNDTTDTNYNAVYQYGGSAHNSGGVNTGYLCDIGGAGTIVGNGFINIDPSGLVTTNLQYFRRVAGVEIYVFNVGHQKAATVTNLTRIDVSVSGGGSSIGVNSRFRLWRRM